MKTLKLLDLAGQVLVVAASSIYYGIYNNDAGGNFLWIYFFTGGWQLLSFILHIFIDDSTWYYKKQRVAYERVIIWTLMIGVLSLVLTGITDGAIILIYLFALLFITPLYAVWYFIIGVMELKTIQQKELIHLK